MNVEFTGRNFELTESIRDYTEKKLQKLTKFLREPVDIRVELEVEKHRHGAHLHVAHRFGSVQAAEESGDMRDAILRAVDKAEKQVRRGNKKFLDRRRRAERDEAAQEWPIDVIERGSMGAEGGPRIIKSSRLPIKPMTIEEAALALDGSRHDFIVFRDAVSAEVNVLYKRKDEQYGLISPGR